MGKKLAFVVVALFFLIFNLIILSLLFTIVTSLGFIFQGIPQIILLCVLIIFFGVFFGRVWNFFLQKYRITAGERVIGGIIFSSIILPFIGVSCLISSSVGTYFSGENLNFTFPELNIFLTVFIMSLYYILFNIPIIISLIEHRKEKELNYYFICALILTIMVFISKMISDKIILLISG